MANDFLVLFQIGPVQEFIHTARRTQDLWAGSFLLSRLCGEAIKKFKVLGGEVIFPSSIAKDCSIPNRFLGRVKNGDPSRILKEVKEEVEIQWQKIASEIKTYLENEISDLSKDTNWKEIWDRQAPQVFQIFYVWHPWDGDDLNYARVYRETEAYLGERKATRWFEDPGSEIGHKCSLCGVKQALIIQPGDQDRKGVRKFWNQIRMVPEIRTDFRENEHLCAPCTVKRLMGKIYLKNTYHAPSTSSIAVSGFLKKVFQTSSGKDKEKVRKFWEAIQELASVFDMAPKVNPLPFLSGLDSENLLFKIEGDWFYEDTFNNLEAKLKDPRTEIPNPSEIQKKVEEARKALSEITKELPEEHRSPAKYLVVVSLDADNMGKVLGSVRNLNEHESLSEKLAQFSRWVFEDFQKEYLSFVVYFGGDEGLIFLALEDLFPALEEIRIQWQGQIFKQIATEEKPTLSAGGCIFHHQHSLRHAIQESRKALEEAKSIPGKDSFVLTILRRSGSPTTARARWKICLDGKMIEPLKVLKNFQKAYEEGLLSDRWLYDLKREEEALKEYPGFPSGTGREETGWEISRLIHRHWSKSHSFDPGLVELVEVAKDLHLGLSGPPISPNSKRLEDFLTLMELASYVSKGGGR